MFKTLLSLIVLTGSSLAFAGDINFEYGKDKSTSVQARVGRKAIGVYCPEGTQSTFGLLKTHDEASNTNLANVTVNSNSLIFTFNNTDSSNFDELIIPIAAGCSIHKRLM